MGMGTGEGPGRKVLVVDDELGVRESIRLLLEPEHEVEVAGSVADGLACLRASPPDLVLLDLGLPDAHGLELLARGGPDLPPVIVVTATHSLRAAADAIRSGASGLLLKPFEPEELRSRVRDGLGGGLARPGAR